MSEPKTDAARQREAAKRAGKASVQEAIGMLIGDDAARARGKAEKGQAEKDRAEKDGGTPAAPPNDPTRD